MSELKEVTLYTDGACVPNPGRGGYAYIMIDGVERQEVVGGFRQTSNNRMEMYAVIKGLETLTEPCRVTVYSDSQYLVRGMMEGWVTKWKSKDWWRTSTKPAFHTDLWEKLLQLCEIHQVEFVWIKGHKRNVENCRCDELSYRALEATDLPVDEGHENQPEAPPPRQITAAGQPCPRCQRPVEKVITRKLREHLWCEHCQISYPFVAPVVLEHVLAL